MMNRNELPSDCDGCNSEEKWILHNIRDRGIFIRLCTFCVLKFNPDSFCCVCYQVFNISDTIITIPCPKCPSLAHLHCVHTPNPYLCPHCSDPNSNGAKFVGAGNQLDSKFAKMLAAASWIASVSMRKAAEAKKMDAECRLLDAAFAQKAAIESLQLLASTIKSKTKGHSEEVEVEVSDPVKPATPNPQEQQMKKKKKKSKPTISVGGLNPVKLSAASPKTKKKKKKTRKKSKIVCDVGIYKKFYGEGKSKARHANRLSSSENVTTVSDNNALPKDEDRWKLQKCALANGNKCGDLNDSEDHIVKEDTGNNGSVSAFSDTGGPQQHPHNIHGVT